MGAEGAGDRGEDEDEADREADADRDQRHSRWRLDRAEQDTGRHNETGSNPTTTAFA